MFEGLQALSIDGIALKKLTIGGVVAWEEEAPVPSGPVNWVPKSIDTDGSIFNGTGWIGQTRLSSSGAAKSANYTSTTGFISAKASDVVRIGGCYWLDSTNQSANYVCTYDADFNFIAAVNCLGSYGGGTVSGNESVAVVTLKNTSTIAYIRVSAYDGASGVNGPGANLIVTINEEIT